MIPDPDTPLTRRRWFQFGIGTLFVAVMVFAALSTYYGNWIRQRHEAIPIERCLKLSKGDAPWLLRLFGEGGYDLIAVTPVGNDKPTPTEERRESLRIARLYPEAKHVYMLHWDYGVHR
jgi:hypothetical protein